MTTIGPSSLSYFPLWRELVMPGKRLTALYPPNLLPKWRTAQGWCSPASSGEFGPCTAGDRSVPSKDILLTPGGAHSGTSPSSLAPELELNHVSLLLASWSPRFLQSWAS